MKAYALYKTPPLHFPAFSKLQVVGKRGGEEMDIDDMYVMRRGSMEEGNGGSVVESTHIIEAGLPGQPCEDQ